ncbi:Hypothetical protein CINCED_3A015694 [Cinara cedri]|uniref:Uncharacterized protein n=1 Tax=Cinara cedri TaxID=506608 RepID=A0A5E4N6G6_9HEMI|nr:Hypothetical protein CINCED_3A015694 [Cinara cedri]
MDSKKNSNPTLQLAEEESTECSGSSGIGSSDSTSSNSLKDVETFKKCCLDSLGNQEDFMIVESTSTSAENISTINDDDTKYISKRKGAAFKKKIKTNTPNVSLMFENIIDHDSNLITDVTESSKCLSRFQKRKRLSRKNNHDFVDINLSDNSEIESAENSLEPSKFRFSEKNKGQSSFDMLDCSLSTLASTNSVKISSDNDNTSEIRENKFFKKPFDSFLLTNNSATDISTAKVSTHKSTQKNINVNDSPFDNIIHESSMVSVSNNNKTLDNTQVSNVNEISLCSTIEIPSFNRTYDIPPNGNSTQKCDLNDTTVELPINETYTLNDHATSQLNNDVSTKSVDIKDVLSDTYTVESNPNKTLTKPRSILKKTNYTINTSANVSNQSKPSVKKQKFLRNLHLNNVSQDYSFTINDSNTILNEDTINDTKRDDCKKFKLKEISHSEDFEIFDNIISGTQENELLTSKNNDINNSISNTLTAVAGTSNNNDLYNISSKCMENTDELTKQSNVILDEKFENDKSICPTLISCKSNSFSHSGFKFDFNKQFGRHSLSYQDKSMNSSMIVKPHNISLNNSVFDKTLGEKSSTFHKSVDNVNLDSNSQICENPKKHLISQKFQPASISSLPISTTINEEVEENNLELSQNISLKAYQSSEPCFAGKPNINANSVVFSNLIDDSLNDDISLDDSKRIKFKNHKNISVSHSVMFENIITNSQESPNCSINQNKTGQSIPYDNSNIKGDEISVFANSDELLSNNESNSSDHDSKNRSMSNVDKSRLNHSKSESLGGKSSEVSIVNNIMQYEQNNSSVSVESANNYSLSNVASGIMENDSLSKSNKTSHVFPKTSVNNLQKKNSILLNEVTTINERVSDSSTNQNETLTQKIMYNGSKNRGDEISMFAIADELLSIRKSVKRSNKKIDSGKKLNLEKSNTTADEFNILDKKYKDSSSKLSKDDFFQGKISSNISSSHKSHNTHSINSNVSVVGSNIQSEQNNSLSPKKPIIKHPKTSILQCLTRTKACTSNNSLTLEDDNTTNISRTSTSSIKPKNPYIDDIGSALPILTVGLDDTGLSLLNTPDESLEQSDLSNNQSKIFSSKRRSLDNSNDVSVKSNKSIKLENNENNSTRKSACFSEQNNQSFSNDVSKSLNITDRLQDTGLSLFIATGESLEQSDLSINQLNRSSKRCLQYNSSDDETVKSDKLLKLKDNTNNGSKISVHSSKLKNQSSNNEGSTSLIISDELQNTEGLTQLNNTVGTLEHSNLSINQLNRTSKRRLRNNSTGESVTLDKSLRRKDNTNNSSKISVHSSKLKNQASNNEGSTSLIISDELQNTEGLTQLNNTVGTLKQKDKSMYQTSGSTSKHSLLVNTKDESVTSNKSLKQNDKRRMSDRLSARKNQSVGNVEPSVSNITNSVQSKKQSLLSKTLKKNHIKTNDMPIASTSSVNSVGNSKNKGVNLEAEDSVFWSTVSESSTNTSRTIPNVNSKSNQLIVIEQIESAIENMSINQITSNHPGAFVIDDSTNRPLTRSSVKRPTNSSPSILTRVLAGNDSFESTFSEISLSSNNIDHTVLEEHVKEKYRSLYSKETWVTKRLYCFLVCNLQPRFNIYSMKCAEKFVMYLKTILKQIYKDKNADLQLFSDMLRYHMARYGIIKTTADYLGFLTDYIPRPYYDKLVPGWNHETSAVKFDDQKYFIPIMEDETFLNKILEHIRTV